MIETIETGSPDVVGLKVTGKLHDEDYKQFVQTMQTILSVERNVRLFVQYEDFPGWDLYAAWKWLKDTDEENRATEEKDRTLDVAGGPGMWNDFPGFGV